MWSHQHSARLTPITRTYLFFVFCKYIPGNDARVMRGARSWTSLCRSHHCARSSPRFVIAMRCVRRVGQRSPLDHGSVVLFVSAFDRLPCAPLLIDVYHRAPQALSAATAVSVARSEAPMDGGMHNSIGAVPIPPRAAPDGVAHIRIATTAPPPAELVALAGPDGLFGAGGGGGGGDGPTLSNPGLQAAVDAIRRVRA